MVTNESDRKSRSWDDVGLSCGAQVRQPSRRQLNVLVVEDSEGDAELVVDAIRQGGFEPFWRRVQSAEEMRNALAERDWEIIVADHYMPSFSDMDAFAIYQEDGRDVPFIIVSGTITEDAAVAAMRAGVHDYLNKGALSRLAPAVSRELLDAENRRRGAFAESQLQIAHSELQRQRDQLALQVNLINLSHDAVITSTMDGVITAWNIGATEIYGWTEVEAVGKLNRSAVTKSLILASEEGGRSRREHRWDGEQKHKTRDGLEITVDSHQVLVRQENGAASGSILEINRDITASKLAEEELKYSLAKNVALLKEVHHRVKNNLQTVCSLLLIQRLEVKDQDLAAILAISERRIASMAMIHEQLYHHEDMSSVDLAEYIRKLAEQLFFCYARNACVTYQVQAVPTRLGAEQAIPCGLILNELISNSFKHAYPDGVGEVRIGLSSEEDLVVLRVSDDGVGVPSGTDWMAFKSMGINLVRILTKQLGGWLEIGDPPGASFTIRFLRSLDKALTAPNSFA